MRVVPLSEADDGSVAELRNRCYAWDLPANNETIAWSRARADPARPSALLGARADRQDQLLAVGFGRGVPGREGILLEIYVDPDKRRQGIGSTLYEALLDRIGPTSLGIWTFVWEGEPEALAFGEHRGFAERDRAYESGIDLTAFDAAAHADATDAALRDGLRFTTLATADSPEMRRRVHALNEAITQDVPSADTLTPTSFEDWSDTYVHGPHASLELFVLALDGDEPVALSAVLTSDGPLAYNAVTGVSRDYRGRKLGLAVKAEALRLTAKAGFREVRTDNHQRNAPMLAINERLGYRRLPGIIELARTI